MTYEQLKEYVSIILDMEKNVYVQAKTLEHMRKKRNSLGIRRDMEPPYRNRAQTDYGEYMLTVGLIFAAIGFVIGIFVKWGDFWETSGIFAVILAPLFGLFIALIAGIVSALVIGPFVAMGANAKEQKEYDYEYQAELKEYDHKKTNDDARVKKEMLMRGQLQKEIDSLESKYKESCARLNDFYSHNVIDKQYQHDIVAVASFYQYLCEKRTYSLVFDQKTGDRGAYNIYNDELRQGIIISKLTQVLDKLDDVIDNQRMLQNTMREANRRINTLSNNVHHMSREITSSIQEQTAIQAYNAERTQAELSYMNTMNIIYNWH